MGTNNKAVDTSKHPRILKKSDSTPERSFFTPWFRTYLGFFRIHLTIVGPEPEKPESYFPLSRRQAESALEAISDKVKSLKEELRC